ncbi:hypothetical protein MIZ01_0612 [Sideroxyarcus emersonii]|uniref:Uncharacterized protein n=1 Tax=Sideroxyarcus emersonii TaxID=2764705 RepID=A0AAN1X8F3_9PROT|nr:hypothetical protein MIZ01_0612 [Sideroxyarcus emersonii]
MPSFRRRPESSGFDQYAAGFVRALHGLFLLTGYRRSPV